MVTKEENTESILDKIASVELSDDKEDKVVQQDLEQITKENNSTPTISNDLIAGQSWEELNLNKNIIKGLLEMNFIKPSKIQAVAYELTMTKAPTKHLIAQSQNGTGKTGGFSIPLVSKIDENLDEVQGIVIVHNREMINQVGGVIRKIAKYTKIKVQEVHKDKEAVKSQIMICTPAMFSKYFLEIKKFPMKNLKCLVIDEADLQMNQDSSRKIIEKFFEFMNKSKNNDNKTQLLMFSATFEKANYKLVSKFFKSSIVSIKVEKVEELTLTKVRQMYIKCNNSDKTKDQMIEEYLKANIQNERIIIFTNKRENTVNLASRLNANGYKAFILMGGDMSPENRDDTVKNFNEGKIQILITTDLLSRGFDEKLVKLIINYDIPVVFEEGNWKVAYDTYLHRIGRTGRFNTKGIGLNLVEERFIKNISDIEQFYKCKIEEITSMDSLIEDFKKLCNEY